MKSLILSCMLAFSASATFGQGYQFTEVVTVPRLRTKRQQGLAGALPLRRLWNPNCFVWGKARMTFRRCSSSARNT